MDKTITVNSENLLITGFKHLSKSIFFGEINFCIYTIFVSPVDDGCE